MKFSDFVEPAANVLINIHNKDYGNVPTTINDEGYASNGSVYNVKFINICVYTDDETIKPAVLIKDNLKQRLFDGYLIDGLCLNGSWQSDLSMFDVDVDESVEIECK